MKPTREQCLEWAKEVGAHKSVLTEAICLLPNELEALILRAYAEGQRDMRERAAQTVGPSLDQQHCPSDYLGGVKGLDLCEGLAKAIRILEIDE